MKKIAFFGLGAMGLPIAQNLAAAGYPIRTAVHRHRSGAETLAKMGGVIAPTAAEAVKDADVVMTIVTDDHALRDLLLNPEVLSNIKENRVIIDMTTCSAEAICEIARCYEQRGVAVIDAPLSGGVLGARQGTMTIMSAGEEEACRKVEDIFQVISSRVFYLGSVGNGKKVKALNNLLVATHIGITAEIYHIARKQDLDPEKFYQVICQSSGNSVQFQNHFRPMTEQNFAPNFTLALMRKDVELALRLGEEMGIPLSRLVYSLYQQAAAFDEEDCRAIVKLNQLFEE